MEAYFHSLLRGERRGLGPALQRAGLRLLSVPYGLVVRGRNWLFEAGWKKTFAAGVPVISVGNLTVGGTGKTPCVEYLARFLRRQDVRVAILSRGYGSVTSAMPERSGPGQANDEALVLEENLPDVPHLQGADRVSLARVAREELDSEVLVLDDGFQHRRLARDLDLVLIDATNPWGHGYLLPRGLLREPVRGLRRADLVLVTHCDQVEPEAVRAIQARVQREAPQVPVLKTSHRPAQWLDAARETLSLDALAGRPWIGFCGLGNPESFRRTLHGLGGNLIDWRVFPDHHDYTRADVEDLCQWAGQQPAETVVLTTQKDLVKLRLDRLGERKLWSLQIELHIEEGGELLEQKLLSLVGGPRCRSALTSDL